ncbi:MAG: hypothetical protein HY000_29005 [Planctomycetes bacterium]|nr:hypothetical protein [Planctomycetota bacterium]
MSEEKTNPAPLTTQAADWFSTVLSLPLIWPKTTLLVSLVVTGLSVSLIVIQLMGPAVPPPPPLDRQRVAEIERQIQQADMLARGQTPSVQQPARQYLGYMHAVGDPDHAERNHQSGVHSH